MAAEPAPRRKPILGCVALLLCFGLFVGYALWIGGEPSRQANRFRNGVQAGMTLPEVLALAVGRWVIHASPKTAGSGDAASITNGSDGTVNFERGGNQQVYRNVASFVDAIRNQGKELSAGWRWSFTFLGAAPGRVTVTVTFDADGHAEGASAPRSWD